jgi:GNAT superfamily N-acetyltransferase
MRIYSYDAKSVPDFNGPEMIRHDALEELLGYEPAEAWQSRQGFLSTALTRIENGLHVYTCTENGRLVHYGWLIERQERSFVSEVRQEYVLPPNSASLFDFYTFPRARGRGLYTLCLRTMLRDAARIPGTEKIIIAVLADNGPSRHVIEKVGFVYECSLFEEVRFGRARRWAHVTETGQADLSSRTG